MSSVFLIACCKRKAAEPCAARDLYQGALFRKSRAWVERQDGHWFVLSARHGLVLPDQILAPYDLQMHDLNAWQQRSWGARVRLQLQEHTIDQRPLTILAGRAYRDALGLPAAEVVAPLEGLGIGEQMAWLDRQVARRAA